MATILSMSVENVATPSLTELAWKVRTTLRKLGLFHAYERKGKLYTFDLPFQLLTTKDGANAVVVIEKTCFPRSYPYTKFINAKRIIEEQIGISVNIQETKDSIALGLETKESYHPNLEMFPTN